ncbi:DUF4037 domain-containing protein [Lactovum odontotermitis]
MAAENFFEKFDSLLKMQGIPAAEKYALSALEEANQQGDRNLFVSIANELGGLYRVTGKFEAGKLVYDAALTTMREMNMQSSAPYATTLINLASVCSEAKQFDEAVGYYQQAEAIYSQLAEVPDFQRAALYNNISAALGAEGQYALALSYARRSLELIEGQPKAFTETATTYTTLGTLYLRMNNYAEAEANLLKAQQIFTQRSGVKPNIHYSQTLNALGELYSAQHKYTESKQMFEQALAMVSEAYGVLSPAAQSIRAKLSKFEDSDLEVFSEALKNTPVTGSFGLDLSEKYYYSVGKPMLEREFSEYLPYIAAGLAGEGSECLGYDDEFSRDHDFGPGFCLWLPDDIYAKIGAKLQTAYENELPGEFMGCKRNETREGAHRVGVFSISGFFHQYIGKLPETNIDWLTIPSSHLLTAVNGKVFEDAYGEFTRVRERLREFYPEDVRLKKLAASVFKLSQAGQYNYTRCIKRQDEEAAFITCNEFVQGVLSTLYLLNRKYMPYYKWMFRGLDDLERLPEMKEMLQKLIDCPNNCQAGEQKIAQIEAICARIRQELAAQQISSLADDFLVNHCSVIMAGISDPQIKQLPVMVDFGG